MVRNARFSKGRSRVTAELAGSRGKDTLVRLTAALLDDLGNFLGPGFPDRVKFDVSGGTPASAMEDRLDGSYGQTFVISGSGLGARVAVLVDREPVREATVGGLIASRWLLLILLLTLMAMLVWFAVWLRLLAANL